MDHVWFQNSAERMPSTSGRALAASDRVRIRLSCSISMPRRLCGNEWVDLPREKVGQFIEGVERLFPAGAA